MKTVYIVCHYFPPDNSVGIRRALYWSKRLLKLGYRVVIITTSKRNSEKLLESELPLGIEVHEYDIFKLSKVILKKQTDYSQRNDSTSYFSDSGAVRLLRKFKQLIFNRYFGQLADNRLIYVIPFILRLALFKNSKEFKVFKDGGNDALIISTAPPWPSHLLSVAIKKAFGFKLIIDYRDPFSSNHVFSQNLRFFERNIDRYICSNADVVTTVSPSWAEYYQSFHHNVQVIRNGYDEEAMVDDDFPWESEISVNKVNDKVILGYFGSVEVKSRIPYNLISFVVKNEKHFELNFYGRCPLVKDFVSSNYPSTTSIKLHGMVPYSESLRQMRLSSINVVAESCGSSLSERGLIPTKVYEYIKANRPILSFMSEDSDSIAIIRESGLLMANCSEDVDLEEIFFNIDSHTFSPNKSFVESLSRSSSFVELEKNL